MFSSFCSKNPECIVSFSLCWGHTLKKSTKSLLQTAKCGLKDCAIFFTQSRFASNSLILPKKPIGNATPSTMKPHTIKKREMKRREQSFTIQNAYAQEIYSYTGTTPYSLFLCIQCL